ncbi:hypothetical protein DPMN_008402 [Dreissena polymorpha]|uniref:Uncharacterized protein n=1 Tax=Dreissena polymorpha TaxID=45954 RepID=A0A9D4MZ82_DREPO|nr:hypothetical protein DPMN_008402 [Dreissena polymorpha]
MGRAESKDVGNSKLRTSLQHCLVGVSSLRWSGFWKSIEAEGLSCKAPTLIYIHGGGNDLTVVLSAVVCCAIASEITYLRDAFPPTKLIWIDVLGGINWGPTPKFLKALEKKRKQMNRFGCLWAQSLAQVMSYTSLARVMSSQ